MHEGATDVLARRCFLLWEPGNNWGRKHSVGPSYGTDILFNCQNINQYIIGQASSSHNQSSLVLWFCQILHYHILTCCRLRRDPVVVKSKQTKNSCFAARASSSSGPGLCSGGRRSGAGTGLLLWDLGGEIRLIWEFPQLLLCFWLAGPRASTHTE